MAVFKPTAARAIHFGITNTISVMCGEDPFDYLVEAGKMFATHKNMNLNDNARPMAVMDDKIIGLSNRGEVVAFTSKVANIDKEATEAANELSRRVEIHTRFRRPLLADVTGTYLAFAGNYVLLRSPHRKYLSRRRVAFAKKHNANGNYQRINTRLLTEGVGCTPTDDAAVIIAKYLVMGSESQNELLSTLYPEDVGVVAVFANGVKAHLASMEITDDVCTYEPKGEFYV